MTQVSRFFLLFLLMFHPVFAFKGVVPTTFEEIITQEVIVHVVKEYKNVSWRRNGVKDWGVLHTGTNQSERAMYKFFGKEDWWKTFTAYVGAQLREIVRPRIDTPEELMVEYRKNKTNLVHEIRLNGLADEVKGDLKNVLKFFDGTLDEKLLGGIKERIHISKEYSTNVLEWEKYEKKWNDIQERTGVTDPDVENYQWSQRRFADGKRTDGTDQSGIALQRAYAEVIKDLINSL